MKVPVPQPRSRIEDLPSGFRIMIPRKWSWGVFLGIPLGLVMWLYGTEMAWGDMHPFGTDGSFNFSSLLLLAWLGTWLYIGAMHVYAWLWNFAGEEVVEWAEDRLVVRRELWGVGTTKGFDLSGITNLRYVDEERVGRGSSLPKGIAFDFRQKTTRFGDDLDEAEVTYLLNLLQNRFPSSFRHLKTPGGA